jgi:hypothetical protein
MPGQNNFSPGLTINLMRAHDQLMINFLSMIINPIADGRSTTPQLFLCAIFRIVLIPELFKF